MFSFSFLDQNYLVKFYHSNKDDVAKLSADTTVPYKAITSCVVSKILSTKVEVVDGKTITKSELSTSAVGLSYCSKKDNFSRKDGRERALYRALVIMMPVEYPHLLGSLVSAAFGAYELRLFTERERTFTQTSE